MCWQTARTWLSPSLCVCVAESLSSAVLHQTLPNKARPRNWRCLPPHWFTSKMLWDMLKGYEEKTSKRGMKEENTEQRRRVVVIDFHMDPKPVSRERGREKRHREERWEENRDGCGSPLVTSFYSLAFLSPSLSLFLSSSSFNLIKLSRSNFYSGWARCVTGDAEKGSKEERMQGHKMRIKTQRGVEVQITLKINTSGWEKKVWMTY